jgi:hypothetical protein
MQHRQEKESIMPRQAVTTCAEAQSCAVWLKGKILAATQQFNNAWCWGNEQDDDVDESTVTYLSAVGVLQDS